MNNWKKRKTPEEIAHELMHELSKPTGLNSLMQENNPKDGKLHSLWANTKSILIVSVIVALAALLLIGGLLALPILIVIGVGFILFTGCKLWIDETKR